METAQIFHLVSTICYIASGLALAVAIFLFFRFRIIQVINDLSGRTMRKNLARMESLRGKSSEHASTLAEKAGGRQNASGDTEETQPMAGVQRPRHAASSQPAKVEKTALLRDEKPDVTRTEVLEGTESGAYTVSLDTILTEAEDDIL